MRYFDTALLLKLYLPEPDSGQATALMQGRSGSVPLTEFHRLEMTSVIWRKNRNGEITDAERDGVLALLEADVKSGMYIEPAVEWEAIFAKAQSLVANFGSIGCRTLDVLHVTLALELKAQEICTTDTRQSAMARAAGLQVLP